MMRARLITLLLFVSLPALAVPDYAREQRWAEEITPAIVVGDPMYLTQKNGHKFLGIYTEATKAKMGVVVVHGLGINPDWGMIGTLRQRLPDFGYATLSIQMPVLAANATAEAYGETFPDAVERIELAVAALKAKGYQRIALVSHSMGSRMTYAYMRRNPADIAAWAALGMPPAPDGRDAALLYISIEAPVLDLYGSKDLPQVIAGAPLRRASLKGKPASRQVVIAGSDHFYAGHEEGMVKVVVDFLDSLK